MAIQQSAPHASLFVLALTCIMATTLFSCSKEGFDIESTTIHTTSPDTLYVVDGGESNETSGLEDVSIAQSSISIYPNPTKGMTFVDGIAANASWKGTIFNSNGSVAKTCSGVGPETVSLEELSPGLYLFSLDMAAGGRHTSRIVVE